MPEDAIIQLTPPQFPPGYCYQGAQSYANDLVEGMSAYLPGNYGTFVVGSSEPAPSDQGKLWIQPTSTGFVMRYYVNGYWRRQDDTAMLMTVVFHDGEIATITEPWAYCDGSTVNGIITPDYRGRYFKCTAADIPRNTLGGENTVTLTAGQQGHLVRRAKASFPFLAESEYQVGAIHGLEDNGVLVENPNATDGYSSPVNVPLTDAGSAHNNEPLYIAVPVKMYVGYSY